MIRGTTRLAAVIGWPVEHSRSPQLLNAAFEATGIDAVMVPIAVPPAGFAEVIAGLRAMGALGASVTVPHKLAAAALCDSIVRDARDIGAVNCLQLDGDQLVGHNTDRSGFVDALVAAGFAQRGVRAVLLGAGGAARAVAHGLQAIGSVDVIARDPAKVGWARALPWTTQALADAFAGADLVVDCTPIGLGTPAAEHGWVDALPLDQLRSTAWVATLVYHRPTLLLERARDCGHPAVDGRAMLVHQGARAFTIWTGVAAPVTVMTQALDAALRGT